MGSRKRSGARRQQRRVKEHVAFHVTFGGFAMGTESFVYHGPVFRLDEFQQILGALRFAAAFHMNIGHL